MKKQTERYTQIHPTVSPEVLSKLNELCESYGMKQSAIIMLAINELYDKKFPDRVAPIAAES